MGRKKGNRRQWGETVVIKGQEEGSLCNGTVLCLDCGCGYTNLHVQHNCAELNAHTQMRAWETDEI